MERKSLLGHQASLIKNVHLRVSNLVLRTYHPKSIPPNVTLEYPFHPPPPLLLHVLILFVVASF